MLSTDQAPAVAAQREAPRQAPSWLDPAVVILVTAGSLLLRAGPLGPSSLWLDDAWVGLVHRADELGEVRFIGISAPGFALLLRTWLDVVGFDEVRAQLLPLAAGVLAPGLAYLAVRRLAWGRAAALVAAVVLATSPVAVDYATRVKQYTVESLLAVVLLAAVSWLLADSRSVQRWAGFVAVGSLCTAMSVFLSTYVAAGVAAALVLAWRRRDGAAARFALVAGGAFAVFAVAWYVLVLAPAIPRTVTGFWSGHYVVVDRGVGVAVRSLVDALAGVAAGLAPLPASVVLVALVASAAAVARRRPELAVLLVAPLAAGVVLAALERAPLGGGRTDIYLYPSLAVLLAGGAEALRRALPGLPSAVAVAVACAALVATAEPAAPYPEQDVRPLVAALEQRREDGDAVLLYPATIWAYALYTADGVDIEADPVNAWGYAPAFDDATTFGLPPGRDDPQAYEPTVAEVRDEAGTVWLLASHWRDDYLALQGQLARAGYERTEVLQEAGAELTRWERG